MRDSETVPGRIDGKEEAYRIAAREVRAVVDGEPDLIANLANTVAILAERLGFFWVGVYRRSGAGLILGPFQGTPACTRMAIGEGVCGAAAARGETVLVPDVSAFPGHIACDARSRSEIVVILRDEAGRIRGVLDVDSDRSDAFDLTDRAGLEEIAGSLTTIWPATEE